MSWYSPLSLSQCSFNLDKLDTLLPNGHRRCEALANLTLMNSTTKLVEAVGEYVARTSADRNAEMGKYVLFTIDEINRGHANMREKTISETAAPMSLSVESHHR